MKPSLVIVGLGNPGKSYEQTRHNVGFWAVDALAREFGTGEWGDRQKFDSIGQDGRIGVVPVLFLKPQTYMNVSGEAVRKVVDFYKIDASQQLLILCDDIDLPLATLRLRKNGGPGTHNGMRSIVERLGEEFPRLRIGLGDHPTGPELSTWVVSIPPQEEATALKDSLKKLPEVVRVMLFEGVDAAQKHL